MTIFIAIVFAFTLGSLFGTWWALRELSGKRFLGRRQAEARTFFGSSG
jgi:hypothetical protein